MKVCNIPEGFCWRNAGAVERRARVDCELVRILKIGVTWHLSKPCTSARDQPTS